MEIPDSGDLIKMVFDNTTGVEIRDYRRALVLSPISYNGKVGLAVVCAITKQAKGYPFEVNLPTGLAVTGVVLSDQIRTIDWKARNIQIVDKVPPEVITQVQKNVQSLIL